MRGLAVRAVWHFGDGSVLSKRIQYSPAFGVGKLGQVLELRFQVELEPFSNELVETLGKWMGESNDPVSLGFAGILIRLGNPD